MQMKRIPYAKWKEQNENRLVIPEKLQAAQIDFGFQRNFILLFLLFDSLTNYFN